MNGIRCCFVLLLAFNSLICIDSHASMKDASNVFEKSIYMRDFKNEIISMPVQQFEFIIKNFTEIIHLFEQSEPKFFDFNFNGRFHSYKISGTPDKFTIKSYNNKAEVNVYWIDENTILYYAVVETKKLGVSITGELGIKVMILRNVSDNELSYADFQIAFKPKNRIVSAALKPFQNKLENEFDKLMDKTFFSMKEFIDIIKAKVPAYLSNENLLFQISALYEENNELKSELESLSNVEMKTVVIKKTNWIGYIIVLIVGLFIGMELKYKKKTKS